MFFLEKFLVAQLVKKHTSLLFINIKAMKGRRKREVPRLIWLEDIEKLLGK
jgi:hypothetical protein